MNDKRETTDVWEDYRRGVEYQERMGLTKQLPMFVDFYEGKQWPAPTKNTKNLPRPVINLVKMICRNKKSAILSAPVKLIYRTAETSVPVNVDKFNRFGTYIQREMGQEELDKDAIHDAVRKGAYNYHYFWDAEARGKPATVGGALRGELIDPLSIFFADPTERDEQKQEWIIIASREHVRSVQEKADEGVDISTITADENQDKYGTKEQEGDKLCTVLTRYFRRDGEVWFEKSTRTAIVNAARPLAPDVEAARRSLYDETDAPNNGLPDDASKATPLKRARAPLYPVVVGSYEPRERCIYGIGEVEGIIPNQKLINFTLGMMALSVQEQAWGKYVVLPRALNGQTITNEPGQVLVDWTETGNGIKKMSEQNIQTAPIQLVETISSLTRVVTGSSEVMTGETLGASMSGAAIAQLQAQAQQPNEELRDAFHLVKAKQGKVLAQFYKLFYVDAEFSYEEEPVDGERGKVIVDRFNSSEFQDVEFEVVVEATAGTKSSAASDINMLDTLYGKGAIDIKTYINAYPEEMISNRSKILEGIDAAEGSQIAQLQAQLQQYEAQLVEAAEVIEKQRATADKVAAVIRENNQLKTMLAQIYVEANQKINMANAEIQRGNLATAEATADATEFAEVIAENMGIGGQGNAVSQMPSGVHASPTGGV